MIPHQEVTREELNGKIDSSLNYSKQMISKKSATTEEKIAYNQVIDNIRYYQKKKVDSDFMIEMIEYHMQKAIERAEKPKTVLSFDKVQSNIANGELKVLSRLSALTEPTIKKLVVLEPVCMSCGIMSVFDKWPQNNYVEIGA